MKYRLLKDLPGYNDGLKKGLVVSLDTTPDEWIVKVYKNEQSDLDVQFDSKYNYAKSFLRGAVECRDWFEPLKESTRWRAGGLSDYWYVNAACNVKTAQEQHYENYGDNTRYKVGNYFKTREQAEAVARAISAVLVAVHDEQFNNGADVLFKIQEARKEVQDV